MDILPGRGACRKPGWGSILRRMQSARIGVLVGLTALLTVTNAVAQRPAARQPRRADTGWIAGRVVRPDGLPQPEADVVLARRNRDGVLGQLSWRARTAFDGRYEIRGVPPGRYLVLVRGIGSDTGGAGRPDPTLFPGVPVTERGELVEVVAGLSTEGIDVWLTPAPRRFTVSGRVFGPDGVVFDSLTLEFGRPGTRATDLWTGTDPGGLFSIDAAPPGPLVLRAHATAAGRVLVGVAATTVAVAPVEDVRITVREPVTVTGQVRAAGGRALPAGLRVALRSEALLPSALYLAEAAAVGDGGRFTLGSEPGPQAVVVEGLPTGWAVLGIDGDARRDSVDVSAARVRPLDLLVGPGVSKSLDEVGGGRLR